MRDSIISPYDAEVLKELNPDCGSIALLLDEKEGKTTRTWMQLFPTLEKVVFNFKLSGIKNIQRPYIHTRRKGNLATITEGEIIKVDMFPNFKP